MYSLLHCGKMLCSIQGPLATVEVINKIFKKDEVMTSATDYGDQIDVGIRQGEDESHSD